jgi:archaellum component FlaC
MAVQFNRVDTVQMQNEEVSRELESWLREISDQINIIVQQIEDAINTLHP